MPVKIKYIETYIGGVWVQQNLVAGHIFSESLWYPEDHLGIGEAFRSPFKWRCKRLLKVTLKESYSFSSSCLKEVNNPFPHTCPLALLMLGVQGAVRLQEPQPGPEVLKPTEEKVNNLNTSVTAGEFA